MGRMPYSLGEAIAKVSGSQARNSVLWFLLQAVDCLAHLVDPSLRDELDHLDPPAGPDVHDAHRDLSQRSLHTPDRMKFYHIDNH